jgi:hypothetical protein
MTQHIDTTDVRIRLDVRAPVEQAFRVLVERFDTCWPHSHHLGVGHVALSWAIIPSWPETDRERASRVEVRFAASVEGPPRSTSW